MRQPLILGAEYYCLDAWSATDLIEDPAKLAAAMGKQFTA
jgi:hypothetical protein